MSASSADTSASCAHRSGHDSVSGIGEIELMVCVVPAELRDTFQMFTLTKRSHGPPSRLMPVIFPNKPNGSMMASSRKENRNRKPIRFGRDHEGMASSFMLLSPYLFSDDCLLSTNCNGLSN